MTINRVLRNRSIFEVVAWGLRRVMGLATAKMRPLPDFIIIGTQRGGTTSLFKYLSHHPDVFPSFPKEVHYFTNYFQNGITWYRSHFPLKSLDPGGNGTAGKRFITGEATPYYLFHPCVPLRISNAVPDVRLIILLRNPIDRAYSHYHHEVKMGVEKLKFREAIEREKERLESESQKLLESDTYRSFNHQHFSYLTRGIYVDQLLSWQKYFGQEQMLVIKSEDFFDNPQTTMKRVTQFLGLTDWDFDEDIKYNYSGYDEIEPEMRKHLREFFRPFNKELDQLLEVSLGWED